ncbi:hypothetical protein GCM10010271_64970 [Streptomyces kurssanovii]|nr:hypothetical protein GCM10010271_64970 [Streptomyces kurssanovii]
MTADVDLETRAVAHAQHALDLMAIGQASERVRRRLYFLAAAFTGTALWAALDRLETSRAGRHLDRGLRLARLSGDAGMEMRMWGHAALFHLQQRQLPDAVAAAQMSRETHVCRLDPLFRSLATVRLAAVQAGVGERTAAIRALGQAETAYNRADKSQPRPAYVDFYDEAEFEGLSGIVMMRLGRNEESEAHLHRALAGLRPHFHRNRVYYSALLATTQLRQGAADAACTTALKTLADDLPGRTQSLFARFGQELTTKAAGTPFAAQWADRYPRGGTA